MRPKSEATIQAEIMLACGASPGVRLFRNPVGEGWVGEIVSRADGLTVLKHARYVTFGLAPSSPDLWGFKSITITPAMVGRLIAQTAVVEVKKLDGTLETEQAKFLATMRSYGAIAGVSRSPEAARRLLFGDA